MREINDTLGHDAGDEALRAVETPGGHLARKRYGCAPLGGDKFLVLVPDISSFEDAAITADKIIKTLETPLDIPRQKVGIKGSLGIAIFPDNGDEPEALIKYADTAMYSVKGQGRGGYAY